MENNLPFFSLSFLDKAYNKFIIRFLNKLDDGNVFKNIITFLLSVTAVFFLIGGIYLTISGLLGDDGFIKTYISDETISSGSKFGSIAGLIFGILLSLITSWALFSILKKRTEQLKELEYNGLLDYVYNKTSPKLILIIGEIIFTLLLYTGILQTIAALIGSFVYAPLNNYLSLALSKIPGMNLYLEFIPQLIYGDYNNFEQLFKLGLLLMGSSFIALIIFYIYKEIYSYLLKLATNLINFLPEFSFRFLIRRKNEN